MIEQLESFRANIKSLVMQVESVLGVERAFPVTMRLTEGLDKLDSIIKTETAIAEFNASTEGMMQ